MVKVSRPYSKVNLARPLSTEEFNMLLRVKSDPFFFSTFIYVISSQYGKVRFNLYPYQKSVLGEFLKNRFNIIKKFRQAGITELLCMFALWLAMYHSHKTINIISIKDVVAKKFLRKIKFMYRNLPECLKVPVVNGRSAKDIGTASELEFSNGSMISSIPTTEEAGRSESLSLLIIDEAAIIRWAEQIWAAALPTLSNGGRAILNSTPYGVGNFFHKIWVNACSGGNEFKAINLRWQMHPERDEVWYKVMSRQLGPRRTAQEIDGDFLTSGNSVFDLMDIRAMEETLEMYPALDVRKDVDFADIFYHIKGLTEYLRVYEKPQPHKEYSIGADVATGRARDYSALSIMDSSGEESVSLKMKLPINDLSLLLFKLGYLYNIASVAPESNDVGLGVATDLQTWDYPSLYYSVQLLKEKHEHKPKEQKVPGWYTTQKNRPLMINGLEEDIRLNTVIIKDPAFIQEAYTFVYNDRNKPIAQGKDGNSADDILTDDTYTDDSILAKAITNQVRKVRQNKIIILPR